ncbi:MAG: gas vesicle protein GvpG [Chloroflexi bacterium]|nr:gas vesicle protein GvpG [Chloroflexota bacterium]
MGFLLDWMALPVMGPTKLVHWLAEIIAEEADRESLDEGSVRGKLLELQEKYDAGEIKDAEYDLQEQALLTQMKAIREAKADQSRKE